MVKDIASDAFLLLARLLTPQDVIALGRTTKGLPDRTVSKVDGGFAED